MKLTGAQQRALEFLARWPWTSAWWGGKPHGGWPKELPGRTFDALFNKGLVTLKHPGRFDRTVMITKAGIAALSSENSRGEQ